jgi:sialidase-1
MSQPRFDGALIEPVCEASIVRLTRSPERNRILFCNPESRSGRQNLTLKLTYDEGMTLPVRKVLERGSAGYSDLAVGRDGTIHCFFERGAADTNRFKVAALTLATFDLKWLEGE